MHPPPSPAPPLVDVTQVVDPLLLTRGAATAVILLVTLGLLLAIREALRQYARLRGIRSLRARFVYRVARVLVLLFTVILLVSVWGFKPENLWVFVTGLLGLIAIGFFAVWSLLSNIIAGVFLFLSDPFKVDDEVEVVGEEGLRGHVLDIRPLFVVLRSDDGHTVYLPNNLLFQKAFRRIEPTATPPEETPTSSAPEGAD